MTFLEHSVGFTREAADAPDDTGVVQITKARLWEVSSVPWGADMNTPTVGFKADGTIDATFVETLTGKIALLEKLCATSLTDEKLEALELHLYQLQAHLTTLSKADNMPPARGLSDALSVFTKSLDRLSEAITLNPVTPAPVAEASTVQRLIRHLAQPDQL